MLAAAHRLRQPADINRVYKRGSYASVEGIFSVKVLPTQLSVSRAVVVVGKKVDKRAVVRNRLRRQLAAQLRELWTTVPAGYDIVISVHADYRTMPTANLRELVAKALTRTNISLLKSVKDPINV